MPFLYLRNGTKVRQLEKARKNMGLKKEKPLTETDALAGDLSGKGFDDVDRLPERIARYSEAKKRSREMAAYLADLESKGAYIHSPETHSKLTLNVRECASYLVFHHYFQADRVLLAKMHSCKKHLLCPMCAIRRGSKQLAAYLDRYTHLMAQNPEQDLWFMTLTVKNGPDLQERFKHLTESFRKYMKRRAKYIQRGSGICEIAKATAGVYSIEFTHSEHGWHPHLHLALLLPRHEKIFFDKKDPKGCPLSKEWHAITGDSFIVEAHKVYGEPVEAFLEVFKYAVKFSSLDKAENVQAYEVLAGRRLLGSFGDFRGIEISEELTDDLPLDHQPYIELLYRYFDRSGFNLESVKRRFFQNSPEISAIRNLLE
jgi:plasmid rolling circle replication initiator protein Rep